MSYYIQNGASSDPIQIASNQGYADLAAWIESLDHEKYGELVHLYEHGWSQEPALVAAQLESAAKAFPPRATDVTATIEGLAGSIDRECVVVSITDGLGPIDESKDDAPPNDGGEKREKARQLAMRQLGLCVADD